MYTVRITIPGSHHGVGDITLTGIVPGDRSVGLHGILTGHRTDHTMRFATGTASATHPRSIVLIEQLL